MTFWLESPCVPLRPLKYTCSLNPDILPEYTDPDLEFYYVDIGNVALEAGIIDCVHMTFANAPSRARKLVKPGDIIVSTVRTYLKAVASIPEDTERLVVSTGFAVLRVKTEADPRFLYRLVQSNPFVEAIVAASTGVSYPAINPSILGDISVPLPDLPTQKAIAEFLDRETARIDQLIEKKQRMVEVLGEKRQAVISRAVTKGLDPSVRMKESCVEWIGALPESSGVRRGKFMFREGNAHSKTGGEELLSVSPPGSCQGQASEAAGRDPGCGRAKQSERPGQPADAQEQAA